MIPVRRSVERATSTRSGILPRYKAVPPPTGVTDCRRAAASANCPAASCASLGTTSRGKASPSTVSPPSAMRSALEGMNTKLLGHRLHPEGADFPAHVALGEDLLGVEQTNWV